MPSTTWLMRALREADERAKRLPPWAVAIEAAVEAQYGSGRRPLAKGAVSTQPLGLRRVRQVPA